METAKRFGRFVAVGGFCTLLMYGLLVIGIEGFGLRPVTSSVAAYVLSALVNYALNYRYTFASAQRHAVALLRFAAISTAGLLINAVIMYFGTERLAGHYLLVQTVAAVVVLAWNFLGSLLWTFRGPAGGRPASRISR